LLYKTDTRKIKKIQLTISFGYLKLYTWDSASIYSVNTLPRDNGYAI